MEIALLILSGSIIGMIAMLIVRSFFPAPSSQQSLWYKVNMQSSLETTRELFLKKSRPVVQLFLSYIFLAGRALRIGLTYLYRKIHSFVTRHLDHRPTDLDQDK